MRNILKSCLSIILVLQFVAAPAFAAGDTGCSSASKYLFEIALTYYQQGKLKDALREFKKLLMICPQHAQAQHYIQLIEGEKTVTAEVKSTEVPRIEPKAARAEIIQGALDDAAKIALPKVPAEETAIFTKQAASPQGAALPLAAPQPEEPAPEIVQIPLKRAGEIRLFINGDEAGLERPILLREGEIFIPLKEIARLLSYSIYDLGAERFKLISPEGQSKEIQVSSLEGEPVVTPAELKDYFLADSQYNDAEKILYVKTQYPAVFKVYAVKRPQEPMPEEFFAAPPLLEEEDTSQKKPTYIPEIARPTGEFNLSSSYSYINYNVSPPYKSLTNSLSGKMYDFRVSGFREYKESAGKFDHSTTWLNLDKPGLWLGLFDQGINLSPLRGQYQSFTGLKIIKGEELNKATFLGGEIENTVSGTGGNVKYLGDIVGIGEDFYPAEWLGIKGLVLYLENEADLSELSGSSSFPRKNVVNFFDTSLKLTPTLFYLTQFAHCYYSPDNEPEKSVSDWDVRTGPQLKGERYNLNLDYEFVGDKYASLGNPSSYQDYKGWDLYGDYRIFDQWSVSSSFTLYQNNVDRDPNIVTNKNQSLSISSAHTLPKDQFLNFMFNRTTSNPSGPQPGPSTQSNLYRTDYSTPFFGHHLLLNYQYYWLDSVDNTLDYSTHTTGGTIFKTIGPLGLTWNLHQELVRTLYRIGTDRTSADTSFSLYYRLNPNSELSFNPSYSWEKPDGGKSTQTISSSAGLWYKVSPDTSFRTHYSISNYNIKTEKNWPRNWSILWSLTKNFGISTPLRFGRIKGRVLLDTNNNTKIDGSDEPAKDVRIELADASIAKTDSQGNFSFKYVVPQRQKISLDLEDLALEWTAKDLEKDISVAAFSTTTVEILLVKSSSISGRVFIDENGDALFQEAEEPLEGVSIFLSPGEQMRVSDEEGNFKFDNLVLGRYKIKINPEDVPPGYEMVSGGAEDMLVLPGEENKGLNFTIRLKPSTAIQNF